MSDTIISVRNVSKEFRFYRSNIQRISHELLGMDAGERIQALQDVSFDIARGEKVGLFGNIGAGRTTILRIISDMLLYDSGTVEVKGKVTPIFDNRLGFDGTLSARDNLRCRASLMDWTKEQISEREQSVLEFAELTELVDQPLKTCPGGSAGRLGFTLATYDKPEIMLYDDNLVLGNQRQIGKCVDRMQDLIAGDDVTFIMTVINIAYSRKLCERGIVLNEGQLVFDGAFNDALKYFQNNCKADPKAEKNVKNRNASPESSSSDDDGGDFDF